ncbi:MAG: hypothetical protein IJW18_08885 [Lachnospiraceae bacterium]|nr:hypothetical protein [Lachnospiraceae bacterium]
MINAIKKFWKDESGMGVVEVVLILIVIVGLVVIFNDEITKIITDIFEAVEDKTAQLY